MTGTAPTGSALWDDYGYHHDGLVESSSMVPVSRGAGHPEPSAPLDESPDTSDS